MNGGAVETNQDVRLSIIFVNYNTLEDLTGALRSFDDHGTVYTSEVIVVDNASTDGSGAEIARLFPSVDLIENRENLGYSKGVNQGIQAAHGEFLLIMNPDIRVREGSLDRLVDYAVENPDVGIAGPKLLNQDGSLQYSSRTFYSWKTLLYRRTPLGKIFPDSPVIRDHLMLDWDHNSTRDVDWMLGAALLVRRSAVEDVGRMDERFFLYFEDVDWCYRMNAHGWRVVYVAQSIVEHRHRRDSARSILSRQTASHLGSMFRFYDKWSHKLYRWKTRRHWARLGISFATDMIMVNAAFLLAWAIRLLLGEVFTKPVFPLATYAKFILFVNLTHILAFAGTGFYREMDRPTGPGLVVDRFLRSLRACGVSYLIITASTFLTHGRIYSRILVTIFSLLLVFLLPLGRLMLHRLYQALRKSAYDLRRAVVIGTNDLARTLADQLRTFPDLGFDLVGFVSDEPEDRPGGGILGNTSDLPRLVRQHRVTDLFCVGGDDPMPLVTRLVLRLADAPVTIRVVSDLSAITVASGKAEEFLNLPMLRYERRTLLRYRPGAKRLFDFLLALAGVILTLPLAVVLLPLGILSGTRPVFARESRPFFRGERRVLRFFGVPREGKGGAIGTALRAFYIRFPGAARIPALYPILAGRFSFVGPFPEEPEEGRVLDEWRRLLVTMKPGLYDASAVGGFPWIPFRDPVGLNLYYLQKWSIGLDIHIVLRETLRASGAGGASLHESMDRRRARTLPDGSDHDLR